MHEMTQNDANQLNILRNNLYIMSSWIIGITYTFNTTEEKKWYWKNMNSYNVHLDHGWKDYKNTSNVQTCYIEFTGIDK